MKTWLIIFLSVAAAIMLYLLLKEPKPTDSHKDDYIRLQADNIQLVEYLNAALKKADSLESGGHGKDSAIASLKGEKKATQKEADKYATAANRLAGEVKVLRRSDTTEFARKCDSLAEAAQNFAFLYEQYKLYGDSLTAKMESQNEDFVKALEVRRKIYDELKQKYDALFSAYTTLFSDHTRSLKSIKRERLKTKIAALLGLIGGAAAVLK
jgi:predicted RNase H-like nuclease (RuvC/YqgF family)